MTTHNTQHEQHDVDATVVEHPSAPEQENDAATSEGTLSAEEKTGTTDSEAAHSTPTEAQADNTSASDAVASSEEALPAMASASEVQGEAQSTPGTQEEQYNEAEIAQQGKQAEQTPAAQAISGEISSSTDDYSVPSSLSEVEAEVRPFTDFIEEFHQAEARLNASVQESEAEAFSSPAPQQAEETPAEQDLSRQGEIIALFNEVPSPQSVIESVEEALDADVKEPGHLSSLQSVIESIEEAREDMPEASSQETIISALALTEAVEPGNEAEMMAEPEIGSVETGQEEKKEQEKRPLPTPLRSTTRTRASRHGSSRGHHHIAVEEEKAAPFSKGENTTNTEQEVTPPSEISASMPSPEQENPRPARRYRFDRPATTSGTATYQAPSIKQENTQQTASEPTVEAPEKAVAPMTPTTEQRGEKQQSAQGTHTAESTGTQATTQEQGNGRRRHERSSSSKEQAAASTQVEIPKTPETTAQEVAPEDLPPLEYAELQKVSSRRRRRHRSGSSSSAAAALPNAAQSAQPVSPDASTPYTIVSGYTVNQMSQGNENNSPFMAPEPSPARGSIMAREARSTNRTEIQRMPAPTLTPTRSTEAGLSSASINQLTTAISQSIQSQTDRMVAEFRRVAQSPTNISVSLPPFPSNERVGVFVDVANLLYSARTLRMGVDFGRLLDFLRGNRRLVRAHAYCPTSPQPGDEQMFLQAVKGLGYRITTKNYKTFSSGAKKADLDLDLCMDVVRLVDGRAVDCIVLVSGDSDFMPMLDYCSDHGVRVEVAAFDEAMSATLRQSCDLFINLSMLDDVLIRA